MESPFNAVAALHVQCSTKKYEYGVCQLFNYYEVFKGMNFAVSYACGDGGPLSLRSFLSVGKLIQR